MESILNKERLSLMAPKLLLRQHWDDVVFADKQSKRAVAKVKLKSNTTHSVLGKNFCTPAAQLKCRYGEVQEAGQVWSLHWYRTHNRWTLFIGSIFPLPAEGIQSCEGNTADWRHQQQRDEDLTKDGVLRHYWCTLGSHTYSSPLAETFAINSQYLLCFLIVTASVCRAVQLQTYPDPNLGKDSWLCER